MEDFEIEEIKWLKAARNKPPMHTDCWVLTKNIGGRLVCTYGVYDGQIWKLFDGFGNNATWFKRHDEIISFFVLPTHETAPTFD